ncbi:hypothetical protein DRN74_00020 [Candidatus Micrarchaeota archaeon]|nr:MAG: hypothetical protein DRN74_00020 [Candidatus Micrarchaeota archaeon]
MERGISPTVSFVLVVTIILLATAVTYLWAAPIISGINEPGRVRNLKNQMVNLDYMIRATAHGDINFTNSYELYAPGAFLELRPSNDSIVMTFVQKALVIGVVQKNKNTKCSYDAEYLNDTITGIYLGREMNMSRVYWGAKGVGDAEIMICYDDIDLKFNGVCSKGKTGAPRILVYMKKIGVNATDNRPIVSIDVC